MCKNNGKNERNKEKIKKYLKRLWNWSKKIDNFLLIALNGFVVSF